MNRHTLHAVAGNQDASRCGWCGATFSGLEVLKGVHLKSDCTVFGGGGGGTFKNWFPAAPPVERPGYVLDCGAAADAVIALINGKPRSPTRDEIIDVLKGNILVTLKGI